MEDNQNRENVTPEEETVTVEAEATPAEETVTAEENVTEEKTSGKEKKKAKKAEAEVARLEKELADREKKLAEQKFLVPLGIKEDPPLAKALGQAPAKEGGMGRKRKRGEGKVGHGDVDTVTRGGVGKHKQVKRREERRRRRSFPHKADGVPFLC